MQVISIFITSVFVEIVGLIIIMIRYLFSERTTEPLNTVQNIINNLSKSNNYFHTTNENNKHKENFENKKQTETNKNKQNSSKKS
jgi:hypothetical protein